MAHDHHRVLSDMQHVASHGSHHDKKVALFETIQRQIVESVEEARALGATDEMLKPFTDTIETYNQHRDAIIATDLT